MYSCNTCHKTIIYQEKVRSLDDVWKLFYTVRFGRDQDEILKRLTNDNLQRSS